MTSPTDATAPILTARDVVAWHDNQAMIASEAMWGEKRRGLDGRGWAESCRQHSTFSTVVGKAVSRLAALEAENARLREGQESAIEQAKSEGMDKGATVALNALAGWLNVAQWEGGDGSETFEGDVGAEVGHIFRAAGYEDRDDLAATKAEGIAIGEERMRERAAQRCTTVEPREPFGSEGYDAAIRMGEELSKIIRALRVTAAPDESGTEGGR